MGRFVAVTVLVMGLLVPSVSSAEDGPHQHKGFYMRLTTGVGYHKTSGDGDVSLSGVGGITTLGFGWALFENFILNADIWGSKVFSPKVSFPGGSADLNGSVLVDGIGAGVTYYVMPMNLYVAASVGATMLSAEIDGTSLESDTGFGLNAVVGKEWWVSDNWGLGIAGQVFYGKHDPSSTIAGGLLFSATYN
jgi:outer membrane protein W